MIDDGAENLNWYEKYSMASARGGAQNRSRRETATRRPQAQPAHRKAPYAEARGVVWSACALHRDRLPGQWNEGKIELKHYVLRLIELKEDIIGTTNGRKYRQHSSATASGQPVERVVRADAVAYMKREFLIH
jgi:hypothetical protein